MSAERRENGGILAHFLIACYLILALVNINKRGAICLQTLLAGRGLRRLLRAGLGGHLREAGVDAGRGRGHLHGGR